MRTRIGLLGGLATVVCVVLLTTGSAFAVSGLTYNSPAHLAVSNTTATVTGSVTCDPVFDTQVFISAEIIQGKGSTLILADGSLGPCTRHGRAAVVECGGHHEPRFEVANRRSVYVSAGSFNDSQQISGPIRLTH